MRRIRIFVFLVSLAMAIISGAIGNGNPTLAGTFGCKNSQCPNTATCDGDHWTKTGDCTISCYKDSGSTGEIVFSGSANCGTSSSGGGSGSGGGGGGGGGGKEFGGGYCYDNWLYDSNCNMDPWNPYTPPLIN